MAICTVVEVYRIASASVNECEEAVDWIWGLWGNGIIRFPAPNTTKERNVDGELEECSTVCQSQITAGTHKQEVLTGNQLLEMATKSQQKTYRPKYGPNSDNSIF